MYSFLIIFDVFEIQYCCKCATIGVLDMHWRSAHFYWGWTIHWVVLYPPLTNPGERKGNLKSCTETLSRRTRLQSHLFEFKNNNNHNRLNDRVGKAGHFSASLPLHRVLGTSGGTSQISSSAPSSVPAWSPMCASVGIWGVFSKVSHLTPCWLSVGSWSSCLCTTASGARPPVLSPPPPPTSTIKRNLTCY